MGCTAWKCEGIRADKPDVNHKIFQVGISDIAKLGLIYNTTLGIFDYLKLGKTWFIKILCLELMNSSMHVTHLA